MIITRTPFRVPFGGGGTDLPGFYKKHGGFIFSATIDKYMYISLNRLVLDKLVKIRYSKSETVASVREIQHDLAREALTFMGIENSIEITSFADIPSGTGMGSSLCYLVGLLKALHTLNRKEVDMQQLAEEASHIEMEILKSPIGKQDQYMAAFGGFLEMHIDKDGKVEVKRPKISQDTIDELEYKVSLYFTNKFHDSNDILKHQQEQIASDKEVEKAMLNIKDIGIQIKSEMEKGNLANFGKLLDQHWQEKKKISHKMSDNELNGLYSLAMANGAEGGKIMGSGGGGLFMFFTPNNDGKKKLKATLEAKGLKEMKYNFDFEGAKVLLNVFQRNNEN
ncbi:MAG TPA: galactokinase [Candidatus Limnocylindria bacterium]|nr:galactokinase [Candidatus Limnocylindria bacterium]